MKPLVRTGCALACLVALASFQQPEEQPGRRGDARRQGGGRQAAPQEPAQAPAEAPAANATAFTFRWGKLGSVPVRETRKVGGKEAVLRYRVGWSASAEGIQIQRTHVTVEKLNGLPAANPKVANFAKRLKAEEVMASPMRLDLQGGFEAFGQPDKKAAAAQMKGSGGPEVMKQLAETVKNPATLAAVRQRDLDAWQMWFGAFRGAKLRPGTQRAQRPTYSGVAGQDVPGRVELTTGKRVEVDGKQCVELTLRSTVNGPQLAQLLKKDLTRVAAERGVDLSEVQVADVIRETEVRGLFELKTWRPYRIQGTVRVTLIDGDDEKLPFSEEQRTFQFDWKGLKNPQQLQAAKAVPAGAPGRKQPAGPKGGKQAPGGKNQPKGAKGKGQKKPQRGG